MKNSVMYSSLSKIVHEGPVVNRHGIFWYTTFLNWLKDIVLEGDIPTLNESSFALIYEGSISSV